jgi:tRNA-splicing ligase RtcB
MKRRQLEKMGVPYGDAMTLAQEACREAAAAGHDKATIRGTIMDVLETPKDFVEDKVFGSLAKFLARGNRVVTEGYEIQEDPQFPIWGSGIEATALQQMRNACSLPITVAGALMPDAHQGYGLPIGGVLATEGAVVPYAVGVDIACRVMVTVFDLPPGEVIGSAGKYEKVLQRNTKFGVGGKWRPRKDHDVLDEDWRVTPLTSTLKDLAADQLGTSGSGNHFVEFGEIEFPDDARGVPAGKYLALVSHSGSRGPGAQVCSHYSKIARNLHPNLPHHLRHLAWLPMSTEGAEYWAAMELMGLFASANHHLIHDGIIREVSRHVLLQVENHHNYAWKETHNGREVIVHRKGATPAGLGTVGYIPGTMANPGFLVEGLGDPRSLDSASHGAGRRMSRKAAKERFTWHDVKGYLREQGVRLLCAGLDEAPMAYKDIEEVMAAQANLVRPIARFMPRMVQMAPAGERPED